MQPVFGIAPGAVHARSVEARHRLANGQGVACMPHSRVAALIERKPLVRWRDNRNPQAEAFCQRL